MQGGAMGNPCCDPLGGGGGPTHIHYHIGGCGKKAHCDKMQDRHAKDMRDEMRENARDERDRRKDRREHKKEKGSWRKDTRGPMPPPALLSGPGTPGALLNAGVAAA